MAHQGYQLTTFLYGLWFGRRKMPPVPKGDTPHVSQAGTTVPSTPASDLSQGESAEQWALGVAPGPVTLCSDELGECQAVQSESTTCGSTALTMLALADSGTDTAAVLTQLAHNEATLPSSPGRTPDTDASNGLREVFAQAQRAMKQQTSHRSLGGLFHWPQRWGTPPWGAARVARFRGHDYQDRMVVATSLPQYRRVLGHSVECVRRGFPVLLYAGADTRRGITAAVPRHVVVLHQPPMWRDTEDLLIFDPATGTNTQVSVSTVVDRRIPPNALGGWQHIMWAVFPRPRSDRS